MTRERFETQRDVVLNERRQNYENRPYGMAIMAITSALYPADHPYNWMTIGSADDIRAMQLEDVQAFFRTYYHPSNASLVLAGDIETPRAFELAEQYFGDLPPGTRPLPVIAAASLAREHRLVLDRPLVPRHRLGDLCADGFDEHGRPREVPRGVDGRDSGAGEIRRARRPAPGLRSAPRTRARGLRHVAPSLRGRADAGHRLEAAVAAKRVRRIVAAVAVDDLARGHVQPATEHRDEKG